MRAIRRRNSRCLIAVLMLGVCGAALPALPARGAEEAPVTIDSRIRTLVYSPNEVFKMYTEYGYQSNIEFSEDEQIATISLGSPSMFRIIPSGNRLFIKALQKDRHTNMTVVTTKRSYQFELFSTVEAEKDVIYVMRFYYPENNIDDAKRDAAGNIVPAQPVAPKKTEETPAVTPGKDAKDALGASSDAAGAKKAPEKPKENYNYSLSGSESVSPVRVYDNGAETFFKFPEGVEPKIFGVNPEGYEYPVPSRKQGDLLVVDRVLPKFSLRSGSDVVCVFNEGAPDKSSSKHAGI